MARRKPGKTAPKRSLKPNGASQGNLTVSQSKDSIKAAEDLAMAAFSSGLKLAAALGSVAARTTGMALASIATGADKFSELVKQEALRSQKANSHPTSRLVKSRSTRRLPSHVAARRRRASRLKVVA